LNKPERLFLEKMKNEKLNFDYGREGLTITPKPSWNYTILRPKEQLKIANPIKRIKGEIRTPIGTRPLKELIAQKDELSDICIVVSDATRPVPSHIILEALIEELNTYGIKNKQIFILIATGLHRRSRESELKRILGESLFNELTVFDHVADDEEGLIELGIASDGIPIAINKRYYESDFKILTGYVEPHFFYGFSGGRKSIVPGIAGAQTIQGNHSAENVSSSNCRFGVYKQNPMHKNGTEVARKVGVDFVVNVCINNKHQITKVATGDLDRVHQKLVEYQFEKVFKKISEPYDIVVCGNGGYPLDINLYQAVKSMAIGEMAVKHGGTIISVNECEDGVGHEKFRDLLFSGESPEALHEKIVTHQINVPDQWEIQILTRILAKADIYVVSSLKETEIGNIGLKYANSVEKALNSSLQKHGQNAKILFLPHGPQILPQLKENDH